MGYSLWGRKESDMIEHPNNSKRIGIGETKRAEKGLSRGTPQRRKDPAWRNYVLSVRKSGVPVRPLRRGVRLALLGIHSTVFIKNAGRGTSLVAQRLGVCLAAQGMQVRSQIG